MNFVARCTGTQCNAGNNNYLKVNFSVKMAENGHDSNDHF